MTRWWYVTNVRPVVEEAPDRRATVAVVLVGTVSVLATVDPRSRAAAAPVPAIPIAHFDRIAVTASDVEATPRLATPWPREAPCSTFAHAYARQHGAPTGPVRWDGGGRDLALSGAGEAWQSVDPPLSVGALTAVRLPSPDAIVTVELACAGADASISWFCHGHACSTTVTYAGAPAFAIETARLVRAIDGPSRALSRTGVLFEAVSDLATELVATLRAACGDRRCDASISDAVALIDRVRRRGPRHLTRATLDRGRRRAGRTFWEMDLRWADREVALEIQCFRDRDVAQWCTLALTRGATLVLHAAAPDPGEEFTVTVEGPRRHDVRIEPGHTILTSSTGS